MKERRRVILGPLEQEAAPGLLAAREKGWEPMRLAEEDWWCPRGAEGPVLSKIVETGGEQPIRSMVTDYREPGGMRGEPICIRPRCGRPKELAGWPWATHALAFQPTSLGFW